MQTYLTKCKIFTKMNDKNAVRIIKKINFPADLTVLYERVEFPQMFRFIY